MRIILIPILCLFFIFALAACENQTDRNSDKESSLDDDAMADDDASADDDNNDDNNDDNDNDDNNDDSGSDDDDDDDDNDNDNDDNDTDLIAKPPIWSFETIDAGYAQTHSLAVSPDGTINALYRSCEDPECVMTGPIGYAMKAQGKQDWEITYLEDWTSGSPSISLDPNGGVHIALIRYYGFDRYLVHGYKPADGDWTYENVTLNLWYEEVVGKYHDGAFHVVFAEDDDMGIRYARYGRKDESGWTFTDLRLLSDNLYSPAIDFDGNDQVRIGFVQNDDGTGQKLFYCTVNGGTATCQQVDNYVEMGDLTVGRNNQILITYGDPDPDFAYYGPAIDLVVAEKAPADSNFTVTTIDGGYPDSCVLTFEPSIAVDAHGGKHVAYVNDYEVNLNYARNVGNGWQIDVVDLDGIIFGDVTLETAENGDVSILYSRNEKVTLATCPGCALHHAPGDDDDDDDNDDDNDNDDDDGIEVGLENVQLEWLDGGAIADYAPSLAIKADGEEVLAFDRGGVMNLAARMPDEDWINEYNLLPHSWRSKLAIDADEHLHVAYLDTRDLFVKYATNASGDWAIETIGPGGNVEAEIALTLDAAGEPRVVYYDYSQTDSCSLHYAVRQIEGWVDETIEDYCGTYADLAVDGDGQPFVAYGKLDYARLATKLAASWQITGLGSVYGSSEFSPRIEGDGFGRVHLLYSDSYTTHYNIYDNGEWTNESIDHSFGAPELAVDKDGFAHLSFYAVDDQPPYIDTYLCHATNKSGSWVSESINYWSGGDFPSSIAAHSDGSIEICTTQLRCASNQSGAWVLSRPEFEDLSSYPALAIDETDAVHLAARKIGSAYYPSGLYYGTVAGGNWDKTLIDMSGGYHLSMALDNQGFTHLGYWRNYDESLIHAAKPSGDWQFDTVIDAAELFTGSDTSITVDDAGVVYYCFADYILYFASNVTGEWEWEVVDDNGRIGNFCSIVLDEAGHVHIAYQEYTGADLKYATDASGEWVTQRIDWRGALGRHITMAIDSNQALHIVYYEWTDGATGLKYITNQSGAWVKSSIDRSGDVGQYASLALDAANRLHIAYYDADNEDLKYATNASGVWTWARVDTSLDAGVLPKIALDHAGNVHIAYQVAGALWHAVFPADQTP